jgi:hypothetical protein
LPRTFSAGQVPFASCSQRRRAFPPRQPAQPANAGTEQPFDFRFNRVAVLDRLQSHSRYADRLCPTSRLRLTASASEPDETFFNENRTAIELLLGAMTRAEGKFGRALAGVGHRFLSTPHTERGSVFFDGGAADRFSR